VQQCKQARPGSSTASDPFVLGIKGWTPFAWASKTSNRLEASKTSNNSVRIPRLAASRVGGPPRERGARRPPAARCRRARRSAASTPSSSDWFSSRHSSSSTFSSTAELNHAAAPPPPPAPSPGAHPTRKPLWTPRRLHGAARGFAATRGGLTSGRRSAGHCIGALPLACVRVFASVPRALRFVDWKSTVRNSRPVGDHRPVEFDSVIAPNNRSYSLKLDPVEYHQ
jgi:hypothetical protein